MEKEMKKLLLVAVSVGVFLLVTITVAIIILTPKTQTFEPSFSSSVPYSHGRVQPVQELPPQPAIISPQEPNFVLDREPEIITGANIDVNNGDSLTIQIPMPTTTAIPDANLNTPTVAQIARAAEPAATETRPAQSASASQPAASSTSTTRPAAAARTTTTTPAATTSRTATPATTGRTINDYWVQTGAFSAQVRAEDARELLSTKGITSIVENREINGRIWYRVRLGPYTSEREANHWLEIVKLIDGFNDSQVRQTVRAN